MATVYVVTAGSGDSYRIERVYLDSRHAYGFARELQPHCAGGAGAGGGMAGRCPAIRLRRPVLACGVVGRVPVAKRRGALRHTDEGDRFDDFAIRQELMDRRRAARGQGGAPGSGRLPRVEVVALSKEKV